MPRPVVSFVSFRLGGSDGVSVEAAKWADAFTDLGCSVTTVAGAGPVDHLVAGLAIGSVEPPDAAELEEALSGSSLVVVENLCSLPLNPAAAERVSKVLRGRPAVMHHHDLPWQRQRFSGMGPPPDDPNWLHVTINDLSRAELADRGIEAVVVRNCFDTEAPPGDRCATRRALGVAQGDLLVMQPTRAIPRKNVQGAIDLARALGATYWLLGPAEDGYGPELQALLAAAPVPVVHGIDVSSPPPTMADAYAACDVVALPSTWEGFGNPALESAVHRRPLAIGHYPVAEELAAFGFLWFAHDDPSPLAAWLDTPGGGLLDHNLSVARQHFSLDTLRLRLCTLLQRLGIPF